MRVSNWSIWSVVVAALFACNFPLWAQAQESNNLTLIAKGFVELLVKGDFPTAASNFDAAVSKALPPEKLREVWSSVIAQTGPFKEQTSTRTEKIQGNDVVYVVCKFEKALLEIKVAFDSTRKISGLFFVPARSASVQTLPGYANLERFTEMEVLVGANSNWALPGTLTTPKGKGPFPGVVLIAGSGPADRDESIGPNKPFRDLAWGLASKGIVVIRYDKRTKVYSSQLAESKQSVTVKEEVIDDALAAIAVLRKSSNVDPNHIFLLGHSLGGMLLPRVAALEPSVAGLIFMAAPTRPLEELILSQQLYLASLSEGNTVNVEALEKLRQQVAVVKSAQLSENTLSTDLPLGIPPKYWLSLRGYLPQEAVKSSRFPVLVLQGGRDYQVTGDDLRNWNEALSSRKNAAIKYYQKLNHLFIEGEGKPNPLEYQLAGHVEEAVVNDVAAWIKS